MARASEESGDLGMQNNRKSSARQIRLIGGNSGIRLISFREVHWHREEEHLEYWTHTDSRLLVKLSA